MNVNGWTQWNGRAVLIARDNIDTDQIYPGRFLSLTNRSDMGEAFFADWRFDEQGCERKGHPFRKEQSIMVAGENFGCGSSREHAVWVMRDHGFRVVLAKSFAPIFKQNAIANGIAPVQLPGEVFTIMSAHQNLEFDISVDLALRSCTLISCDGKIKRTFEFAMEPFDVHCLRQGVDTLGFLLSCSSAIENHLKTTQRINPLQQFFSGDQ